VPFRFLPVFSWILGIRKVYRRAPTRLPWPPEYLELEYNVDIISDVINKALELDLDVENLTEMRGLMYHMDSTIQDMKSNTSLTSLDIDELSKRILKLYKKLGVPSLGQLRKLETSKMWRKILTESTIE